MHQYNGQTAQPSRSICGIMHARRAAKNTSAVEHHTIVDGAVAVWHSGAASGGGAKIGQPLLLSRYLPVTVQVH